MLESLGYPEAPARDEADLILFNTCSIREKADERFVAHLGEAKRVKSERPDVVVGVGGCWAQSVKEEVFARFPFVDVAFGPGQVHKLAEFLISDSLSAQGYFEFEGFTGHLPAKRAREHHAWVQISVGCNCVCSYCIVPSTRGREVSRPAPSWWPRSSGWPPTASARSRCSARTSTPTAATCRASSARRSPSCCAGRRDRRDRAHPLHEPSPEGHARGRDPRPRRAARAVRAHSPAAPVRVEPGAQAHAAHLHARALPRPGGDDPRARPRLRAHHRHHRRISRARRRRISSRRSSSSTRSATTARSPSSTRRGAAPRPPSLPDQVPHELKVERMQRLVEVVQRRAHERAQRFVGRTLEVLVEGPSRTDPDSPARPLAAQQGGQLQRPGRARRTGRGRDPGRHQPDAQRAGIDPQPSPPMSRPGRLAPHLTFVQFRRFGQVDIRPEADCAQVPGS